MDDRVGALPYRVVGEQCVLLGRPARPVRAVRFTVAGEGAAPGLALWTGFGWQACPRSGCFEGGPAPRPVGGDPLAGNVPLGPTAEPTVAVMIYNNTDARRVIEVYDVKTGAWTRRLAARPWQRTQVLLHRDASGRGGAILRWDHDPRFDVRYGAVGTGDELK